MSRFNVVYGIAFVTLGVIACKGVWTIRYEARGPRQPARRTGEVTVYEIDCRERQGEGGSCTYEGRPLPWAVRGAFYVSEKALKNWSGFRGKVRARAGQEGCPAVAVLRSPPAMSGFKEPIGALCVEPGIERWPASMSPPVEIGAGSPAAAPLVRAGGARMNPPVKTGTGSPPPTRPPSPAPSSDYTDLIIR